MLKFKTSIQFLLCFLFSMGFASAFYAQSTRVVYGTDSSAVGKYDRLYQMVASERVLQNTQLKFDAVQWGQVHPSFTVEQRVWKDLIVEPNLLLSSFDWSTDGGINFAFTPNVTLKYFFNRAYRERKGASVVGFSADYIAVGLSYTMTDDKSFFDYELEEKHVKQPQDIINLEDDFFYYRSWYFLYGIQRKISKMAYADVSGGFEKTYFGAFGTSKLLPVIKIKLGFSLSPEQFKRLTR